MTITCIVKPKYHKYKMPYAILHPIPSKKLMGIIHYIDFITH